MVPIPDLWMPIVVSAVLVWLGSAIVWMVLPHHRSDYQKLPDEEAARTALRGAGPGQYNIPHSPDMKAMGSPEMVEKFKEGPVALLTMFPPGPPNRAQSRSGCPISGRNDQVNCAATAR